MGLVPGRSQWNVEHNVPCRNPQCKSYGKPHFNCQCSSAGPQTGKSGGSSYTGPSSSITKNYAEGGNVESEHPCAGVHKTDCEFYGGDPELGQIILKNAILRHTSEDDVTDSMLGKSQPEQAMHGLLAHSGASHLLGDVTDSLFEPGKGASLDNLGNKQLSKRAAKLLNKISMMPQDQTMDPELMKSVIRPGVEKIIGNKNPHVIDAVISAISKGETDQLGAIIDHASKVSKGHKSIHDSIESLFSGNEMDHEPNEAHREKLKKFISDGGLNAQIMNQTQAMNEQPVQAMAEGGVINANAPQNPIEKAFSEQALLMGATKSGVNNYLQQQQPQAAQKLPFDSDHKNTQKEKDYNKILDIANKPLSVLKHIQSGTVVPDHVKHLVGMYPDFYNHLGKKATEQIVKAQLKDEKPSYRVRQGLSLFLGSPLDSTMTPQAIQSIQAMYAAKQAPQAPPGKTKKNTSKLDDVSKSYETADQAAQARQKNS